MAPAFDPAYIAAMRLFVSHRPKAAAAATPAPAKPVRPVPKEALAKAAADLPAADGKVPEIGGPEGPEPTRYGDWERKGIASDF